MNLEHAKRVLDYSENEKLRIAEEDKIILEICERLIAIENRLHGLEARTRDKMDDFLRGATTLSVRFDRLEAKLNNKEDKSC